MLALKAEMPIIHLMTTHEWALTPHGRTPWILCDDFVNLHTENATFDQIKGMTIDIENVLTDGVDGGNPGVRPEALDQLGRIQATGKQVMLATNCRDTEFVDEALAQINAFVPEPISALTKQAVGKSKTHAEMFLQAANRMRLPVKAMAHVDDQLKSQIGARRADYGMHIWTLPWGEFEHSGVASFRPYEMKIARNIIRLLPRTVQTVSVTS